jgi:epoxyqueuosine reductase
MFLKAITQIVGKYGLHLLGSLNFKDITQEKLNKIFGNFEVWKLEGCAAQMDYMKRDLRQIFEQLAKKFRSCIVILMPYQPVKYPSSCPGYGKIASYALMKDYHITFKNLLQKIAREICNNSPERFKVFTDAFPYLEKPFADLISKVTFQGKNTLLIHKKLGSYFLLGQILLDFELPNYSEDLSIEKLSCGSCSRCQQKCPTGALRNNYLDASKCISYLTIERRGPFTLEEIIWVNDWIFGCDICQECCPFNHKLLKSAAANLGLFKVVKALSLNEQEFNQIFRNTPVKRAKFEGFVRNAIAVAFNQRLQETKELIKALAYHPNITISETAATVLQNWPSEKLTIIFP